MLNILKYFIYISVYQNLVRDFTKSKYYFTLVAILCFSINSSSYSDSWSTTALLQGQSLMKNLKDKEKKSPFVCELKSIFIC